MKYQKWVGADLKNLLTLPWEEFTELYPETKQTNWKALRRYYIKTKGDPMEKRPEQSLEDIAGRLTKTWEVSAWNRESQEWETTTNHAYEHGSSDDIDTLFPQVESAKIRPTKRQRAQRLGEALLTYGDGQVDFRIIRDPRTLETEVVPQHNLEMHRIILQMNAYYMPETTVNGGDFADFAASSRFPADSDHHNGSMTLALNWIHDFYAQMVSDNPNAKHVEVASNHGDRARKKVLKDAPEFYNFYRPGEDYPAWTYYSMAKLGELGIIHPSGYPQGHYIHGDEEHPQILFKHGDKTGKNAVYQEADTNPTINVVRFHNHGERMIKRTTRAGQQLFYLILGSSCMNDGPVPGYHSAIDDLNQPVKFHNPDHVNSFAMIRDYGQGRYEVHTIDVVDGKSYYDGMEWDGTEPFEWEYRYGYIKEDE